MFALLLTGLTIRAICSAPGIRSDAILRSGSSVQYYESRNIPSSRRPVLPGLRTHYQPSRGTDNPSWPGDDMRPSYNGPNYNTLELTQGVSLHVYLSPMVCHHGLATRY